MEKRKQKGENNNNNLTLSPRSIRSSLLVCLFRLYFSVPWICLGFLHNALLSTLTKHIRFCSDGHTQCPHHFIFFTSVEVIWRLFRFPLLWFFYSWHFVPKHILLYKNCTFHRLILLCSKKISTQITENDMMHYPSLRKSSLTQAKRPIFLWWRWNLSEITLCSVVNHMMTCTGCQIDNIILIPISNYDLNPIFYNIFYRL